MTPSAPSGILNLLFREPVYVGRVSICEQRGTAEVTDESGPGINTATKYVVSHRPVSLDWKTTVWINGDVVDKIKALKTENGPELQVHGSGDLIQTLLKNDLVDELWLKTFPVALGSGKRLFAEGTVPGGFTLIENRVSPSGAVMASYARADAVKYGSFAPPSAE